MTKEAVPTEPIITVKLHEMTKPELLFYAKESLGMKLAKTLERGQMIDKIKESDAFALVEMEELEWEKGERCKVEIDGEFYEGVITSIKGGKAKVTFDDGDKDSFHESSLMVIEDDPEIEYSEEEVEEEVEVKESKETTFEELPEIKEINEDDQPSGNTNHEVDASQSESRVGMFRTGEAGIMLGEPPKEGRSLIRKTGITHVSEKVDN